MPLGVHCDPDFARLGKLVLVHPFDGGKPYGGEAMCSPAVCIDLATDQITLVNAFETRVLGTSSALYSSAGRSMRAVVAEIENELGLR